MNTHKFLTLLLAVIFCASPIFANVPPDAEATQLLVGDWIARKKPRFLGGGTTFRRDGTFSSHGTFETPNGPVTIKVEGKWRVERGILIEELTRSSHPNIVPPGLATGDTLLSITDKEYRYRTEKGTEDACFRAEKGATSASPK